MPKRTAAGEMTADKTCLTQSAYTEMQRIPVADQFGAKTATTLFVGRDGTAIVSLDGVTAAVSLATGTVFGTFSPDVVVHGLVFIGAILGGTSVYGIVVEEAGVVSVRHFDALETMVSTPMTTGGSVAVVGHAVLIGIEGGLWYHSPRQDASFRWDLPATVVHVMVDRDGGPVVLLADGSVWTFDPAPTRTAIFDDIDLTLAVLVDTNTGIVVTGTGESTGSVLIDRVYPFGNVPLFGSVVAAEWNGIDIRILIDGGGAPELVNVTPALGLATSAISPAELVLTTASALLPPRSSTVAGSYVIWNGVAYLV